MNTTLYLPKCIFSRYMIQPATRVISVFLYFKGDSGREKKEK